MKGGIVMGKAKGKAKQAKGKLQETVGGAMDDKEMKAEGRGEQVKGKAEETAAKAAERVKKSGR
ncbi:CsbD family protein [Streptomyces sp. NPDC057136]|uniref:CsbD family protein n=1 Tax=Streptomyces sp. NPDC057136 TaxID=3346029 RepID=UPI0036402A36